MSITFVQFLVPAHLTWSHRSNKFSVYFLSQWSLSLFSSTYGGSGVYSHSNYLQTFSTHAPSCKVKHELLYIHKHFLLFHSAHEGDLPDETIVSI